MFTTHFNKQRQAISNITGIFPLNNSDVSNILQTNPYENRHKGWYCSKLLSPTTNNYILKHSTKRNIVSIYDVDNDINQNITSFHESLRDLMGQLKHWTEQTKVIQTDVAKAFTSSGLEDINSWSAFTIVELARKQGIVYKEKVGCNAVIKSGRNTIDSYKFPTHINIRDAISTKPYSSEYESKFAKILFQNFPDLIWYSQYAFRDLKGDNDGYLRYDFYFPDYELLIEINGPEHEQIPNHDVLKKQYALDNNIRIYDFKNSEVSNKSSFLKKLKVIFEEQI
tara:strand:+ start:196 stop:1041 length:846 start_codon:yes stop_codon:yes gene_type:complete